MLVKVIHADGNLLTYWKFDETTAGSTVVDSSGNGYDGTPHNSPAPSTDVPSTITFSDPESLKFTGTEWVSIPDNPAFAMTSATFSTWVKFTNTSAGDMNMIAKRSSDGSSVQWQFGYNASGNQFKVSLANGGSSCCTDFHWSPSPSLSANTWYNIAVVIDGTNHTLTWYQNGASKLQQDITGHNLGTEISADLTLGASYNGTNELLQGLLDDTRIYNTALTGTQVADIAAGNSGPGVPTPTPTPTPAPSTPTPTPSSQSNTSNAPSTSSNAPSCTSSPPGGTADLFQIDSKQTQATLFFAPAIGNVTNYAISYGYDSADERFSTFTNQGNSSGVLQYTINDLSPNLTYYMKVRPYNGCKPGNWSNQMKITTTKSSNGAIQYYENFLSQVFSIFPRQTTVLGVSTTRAKDTAPSCENYTVMPGDSLWQIAQEKLGEGIKYLQIEDTNSLITTILNSGQKLKIGC